MLKCKTTRYLFFNFGTKYIICIIAKLKFDQKRTYILSLHIYQQNLI